MVAPSQLVGTPKLVEELLVWLSQWSLVNEITFYIKHYRDGKSKILQNSKYKEILQLNVNDVYIFQLVTPHVKSRSLSTGDYSTPSPYD